MPVDPPLCVQTGTIPAPHHVMCVEDDPDIRAILELSLHAVGHIGLTLCASGDEALATVEAAAPDLILLDVMMPGRDGIETLKALRANAATAHIPIIFMTARVQPQDIQTYHELGALDVLTKPFDPMTLPDQVRACYARVRN